MYELATARYNVVMFAHNEAASITNTLSQAYTQCDERLQRFFVIANGCTDDTVGVVSATFDQLGDDRLRLVDLAVADKCNAWNHYVHELADDVDCHFCIDADVLFSAGCFPRLAELLAAATEAAAGVNPPHIVAGMPLSGRNRAFYESLVRERACFFGNLYGMSRHYMNLLRRENFRLPMGLNWIDSFLTKAANTDLGFGVENLPNRVIYTEGVGFYTQSLSMFRWDDIQLYKNRIARYELGKLQERHLDRIPAKEWPADMKAINRLIWERFEEETTELTALKRWLVKRRLVRLLS